MKDSVFLPADILIPRSADKTDWSVIACDQFSSEREYWDRVKEKVGSKFSTLHMVIPEAYLDGMDLAKETVLRNQAMDAYLAENVFYTLESSYVYVERRLSNGKIRRGIVGMMDLEQYDYTEGSSSPIRASEKTIVERLPARIEVREGASLELPHVMVLIDDPDFSVVEPLSSAVNRMEKVYDFELMEGGGHIRGWRVCGRNAEQVQTAVDALGKKEIQLVIGDGNHSLAAARECWLQLKDKLSPEEQRCHPARYALVELGNIYDGGILFEPIHRIVFHTDPAAMVAAMKAALPKTGEMQFSLGILYGGMKTALTIPADTPGDMIRFVQEFLDKYLAENGGDIDYIHGDDSLTQLAEASGSIAFFMPALDKGAFFSSLSGGAVYPRKSFSIGEARDKRYYLECRKIK